MRKIFALVIVVLVFFPLAFAAMTVTSIRPWVLDRGFYERIVSDERIYTAMLTGELPNQFNRKVFTAADQIPAKALDVALREVVTPAYLRTQSLNVVNQVFDFIEGRDGKFEIALDITPVKATLAGEAGLRFAHALAAALPSCESGQEPVAPGGSLVRCIAATSSVTQATDQIVQALPAALGKLPNRIILNNPVDLRREWPSIDWFLGATVRTGLDTAIIVAILSAVAAGLVAAYLGADDLRERLRWLSLSLFVPASLFVLMGLSLATPLIAGPLRNELNDARWDGVQYSEGFRQAVIDTIVPVIQQVGNGFLLTGVLSCLIALGLLAWSLSRTAAERHPGKMVNVPMRNP